MTHLKQQFPPHTQHAKVSDNYSLYLMKSEFSSIMCPRQALYWKCTENAKEKWNCREVIVTLLFLHPFSCGCSVTWKFSLREQWMMGNTTWQSLMSQRSLLWMRLRGSTGNRFPLCSICCVRLWTFVCVYTLNKCIQYLHPAGRLYY